MITGRAVRDQLQGIVAVWMTNGNEWVDAGNDTRYDMFSGGWVDAVDATQELVAQELIEWRSKSDPRSDGYDGQECKPTAKGIFYAFGG